MIYLTDQVWYIFFFFKQKTAYEMRISDWSSDVCSSDLRQGSFAADILYFAGENSPVQVPVHIEEPIAATLSGARPKLPQPVPAGHDYDVADADVLMNRVRIEDGEIVLPEGIRYRILVMPEDRRITRDLLAKLAGDRKSTRLNSSH